MVQMEKYQENRCDKRRKRQCWQQQNPDYFL
jgi:hypothetical protein